MCIITKGGEFMENFSVFGNICSILSLFVSLFLVSKVVKLEGKVINKGDNNKGLTQNIKGNKNSQNGSL